MGRLWVNKHMSNLPKYMNDSPDSRKKGNKGEKVVKDTINSGALWFDKGDKKFGNYLIEVKETDKKGFRVTTKLVEKIINEAYTVKKEPLIVVVLPKYILSINIKIR